jgi:hypothetical protein
MDHPIGTEYGPGCGEIDQTAMGLTRASTALRGNCAAAGDMVFWVILGFQTGHGAMNGNPPRPEGDREQSKRRSRHTLRTNPAEPSPP